MSSINMDRQESYLDRRRAERREYWLIFCVIYPALLLSAVLSRLVARVERRPAAPGEPRRSVFAEARIAAASCIPFAFM